MERESGPGLDISGNGILCSAIVPVFNGAAVIERCLDALAGQSLPAERYEIIVVDDGSTDESAARIEAWAGRHPQYAVTLLRQKKAGPAAARNRGAQAAQGPLLLFTDADCIVTPHWMMALARPFCTANPPAGAMGVYLSRQRSAAARFAQLEFEDRYWRMARKPDLDFVATYSAAFRRDIFLAEGGFDVAFPRANNEDTEFSYRLSKAGHRMRFVPDAQVYHTHAESWFRYARTKMGRGFWRTQVYRRHPDKALKDTYTPFVLKLQIGLAPLVLLGALVALASRSWRWLLLGLPFLVTTAPFTRFVAARDPALAPQAPWGLWLRSIAFAVGVAGGLLAGLLGRAPSGAAAQPDHLNPSAGEAMIIESTIEDW